MNRCREEGDRLDLFLSIIARRLPGSWGLVYERDDEMPPLPARTLSECANWLVA
jgi:hypothetical protein